MLGSARPQSAVDHEVWHLLSDPEACYHDLGPDFYDNRAGVLACISQDPAVLQFHPQPRAGRRP